MKSIVATATGSSAVLSVPGDNKDDAVLLLSATSWGATGIECSADGITWVGLTLQDLDTLLSVTKSIAVVVKRGLKYRLQVTAYTDDITLSLDE